MVKKLLIAAAFVLSLLVFSCSSFGTSDKTSSLSFRVARGAVDGQGEFIEISVKGDFSAVKTIPFKEGETAVFEKVPVGAEVFAEAVIYTVVDGERKITFRGESPRKKIVDGKNELRLVMKKVSGKEGEPEEPVEPEEKTGIPVYLYVSSGADSETADGTQEKPFGNLGEACEKIIAEGKPDFAWTVYVSGEITGVQQIIPDTLTAEKAKSILVTGATGLDEYGVPRDVFDMGKAGSANGVSNGTVLIINTAVPVTITNLKITGGYGSGEIAGGINIAQEAVVSLGDGALVIGNRNPSSGRGGGVHNEGTLFMYGSAVVGDKTNGGKTDESEYTYAISSSSYNDFNSKKMSNYASTGGGIFNGKYTASDSVEAKLYLGYKRGAGGEPVKEELTGGLYYNSGTGGAIYNGPGSIVNFDSGNIMWNGSEQYGGGVFNAESAAFVMTGGRIEYNKVESSSDVHGGGVVNEKSSSKFIMGGGVINHNKAVCNNTASSSSHGYGGGVYNGGLMFMYGAAVIGNKDADSVATEDNYGNFAREGGGIYNARNTSSNIDGKLYIGYEPNSDWTPAEEELSGGIYQNYAKTLDSQTDGGGAISSAGLIKISSGTIAYNATTGNGGAIYKSYSAADDFTLSGDADIPGGIDEKQDVYLAGTTNSPTVTIAGTLTGGLDTIILTPEQYKKGTVVLKLATDAGTQLEYELDRFVVTKENGISQWGINSSDGKMYVLQYGDKVSPDSIGDIVFSDGSAVAYDEELTFSTGQKSAAIAVIFSTDDKILGVGIKNDSTAMEWAKSDTTGSSKSFSNLYSTTSPSSSRESSAILTATITGDTDGSDNWDEICKEDTSASSNMGDYPVWQWVNNYGKNYSISESYADNWYLPTLKECVYLYNSLTTVTSALEKIDGDAIPAIVWTGNTSRERAPSAHRFSFSGTDAPRSWDNNGGKGRAGNGDQAQIAIRQF